MPKVTNKFAVSMCQSISWMASPNLRAYLHHKECAGTKGKPFSPFEDCIGLRYAAAVVKLRDCLNAGTMKQKQAEEILARLDAAYKDYISVVFGRDGWADRAIANLDEIEKDIPLEI